MGEGSFGQVFEGKMTTPSGEQRVVMKRVKTRVLGAEEMSQMEHLLNVYASRVARGHCADFLGYCEVAPSEATPRLTAGLWLVWKYEGSKTLSYYLRRRDTVQALAQDLEIPESAAVPMVLKQIFEGLAAFHAAGLVHRDIKPLNIIFAEDTRKFKLIDLGACADLRTGTNYVPEESILDLNYCPPEQYVMPTDSPHIAKQGLFKMAISPMLWAKHKPDRFDTWSAGMVMLQLCIPPMRNDRSLRNFNLVYGPKHKYDLAAWRKTTVLSPRDCAILDADDGAGWDLLQSLLAPRHIEVDDNGGVSFVNDSPFPRISAYEALKHKFIKNAMEAASAPAPAAAPALVASSSGRGGTASGSDAASRGGRGNTSSSSPGSSPGGSPQGTTSAPTPSGAAAMSSALGLWRDMTGRLFDLEAKIMRQASATELQTTTVKRLKEQVESGKADPALLKKEEKVLDKMQNRLANLQQDFTSTANQASSGIFSWFGGGRKQQQAQQQEPALAGKGKGSGEKGKASLQALRAASAASAAAASTSPTGSMSANATPASSMDQGPAGIFSSMWERLSSRLNELEGKISNQASATERQSLVVKRLRAKVKAGEAEAELLSKAERTLGRMERRLLTLDRDYRAVKQNATGALAGNIPDMDARRPGAPRGRGGSQEQSVAGVAEAVAAAESALNSETDSEGGSFWSRLMGGKKSGSGGSKSGSGKEKLAQAAAATAAAVPPPPPQRSFSPFRNRSPTPQAAPQPQQQAAPPPPRSLSPFFRTPGGAPPAPAPAQPAASQPAQPQQGGYRSIFGAFGGGSGDGGRSSSPMRSTTPPRSGTPPRSASPAPPAAAAKVAPPAAPAPATKPAASSGGSGGIFSFFRPKPPTPAPEPAAPLVPPPAAPASASSGDALVEGASRVIRSSLGFTGLAAKVAADLANSLKADAERYLKEMEAAEAAKRQQRMLDMAFIALLREAAPPLPTSATFEDAEARFAAEARWQAVAEEARRRQLFGQHLGAAKKAEKLAVEAAEAAYRAALRRYQVRASSKWEEFAAMLPHDTDPMLGGIEDPARRQQLFVEIVAELQLQEALQAAAKKAEDEFTLMLQELREPAPITSTSTWSLVRKAVASDARCQALPERRRRELFEAYTATLFEKEVQRLDEAAAVAAAAEEADSSSQAAVAAAAATAAAAAPVAPAPAKVEPAVPTVTPPAPVAAPAAAAAAAAAAPAKPAAPAPAPGAPPVDDDDLASALASMEAALESAIKAVASVPPPAAIMASNAIRDPPAPSLGPNGVGNNVVVGPGGGEAEAGGLKTGGVFEGSRLDELRREQARLRAEYDTMAMRLREMEERLKAQAQLMSEEVPPAPQQEAAAVNAAANANSNGVPRHR